MSPEGPIGMSPEEEQDIEKEPVSRKLKTNRFANEFLKKLRERNPDATEDVTFVDDEEKAV